LSKANDDMATAHHEAGHAVAAWLYGIPICHVEIDTQTGRGHVQPEVRYFTTVASHTKYKNLLAHMCAAGPLAESAYYHSTGKQHVEGLLWSTSDWHGLSAFKGGPSTYCAETHPVTWAVKSLFTREDVKMAICALAGALLLSGRLNGREVDGIMKRCISSKGRLPLAQHQIKSDRMFARFDRALSEQRASQAVPHSA